MTSLWTHEVNRTVAALAETKQPHPTTAGKPGVELQPQRASQSLLEYLDSTDQPFSVHMEPLLREETRKRKRRGTLLEVEENLFDERLAVKYKVEPWDDWKSLRRYKAFTGEIYTLLVRRMVMEWDCANAWCGQWDLKALQEVTSSWSVIV
jgi:hypothetical protein